MLSIIGILSAAILLIFLGFLVGSYICISRLKNCMNCKKWDHETMCCSLNDESAEYCIAKTWIKGRPVGNKWEVY